MRKEKKFSTYDLVTVGVMAAVVFATTYFLKIGPIPTPTGNTMIKLGNAFCLLAGLLFGGLRGGLASGIGSAMFDLLNPVYVKDAPFTLIRFFLMAWICGVIAHTKGRMGRSTRWNLVGAVTGSVASLVFHIGKGILELMLEGSGFAAAVGASTVSLATSLINAVVAVAVSVLIAPACLDALHRAGLADKLFPHTR